MSEVQGWGGFGPRKGELSSRVAGKSRGVLPGRWENQENPLGL